LKSETPIEKVYGQCRSILEELVQDTVKEGKRFENVNTTLKDKSNQPVCCAAVTLNVFIGPFCRMYNDLTAASVMPRVIFLGTQGLRPEDIHRFVYGDIPVEDRYEMNWATSDIVEADANHGFADAIFENSWLAACAPKATHLLWMMVAIHVAIDPHWRAIGVVYKMAADMLAKLASGLYYTLMKNERKAFRELLKKIRNRDMQKWQKIVGTGDDFAIGALHKFPIVSGRYPNDQIETTQSGWHKAPFSIVAMNISPEGAFHDIVKTGVKLFGRRWSANFEKRIEEIKSLKLATADVLRHAEPPRRTAIWIAECAMAHNFNAEFVLEWWRNLHRFINTPSKNIAEFMRVRKFVTLWTASPYAMAGSLRVVA